MASKKSELKTLSEHVVERAAMQQDALLCQAKEGEAYLANIGNIPCFLRIYNSCCWDQFTRDKELAECLQHPNILSALAICDTPRIKAVAYRSPPSTSLASWLSSPLATWPRRLAVMHGVANSLQAAVTANEKLVQQQQKRQLLKSTLLTHGMLPRVSPDSIFIDSTSPPVPINGRLPPRPPSSVAGGGTTPIVTDWVYFYLDSSLAPHLIRENELEALSRLMFLMVLPDSSTLMDTHRNALHQVWQAISNAGSPVGVVHPAWVNSPPGILRQVLDLAQWIRDNLGGENPVRVLQKALLDLSGLLAEVREREPDW